MATICKVKGIFKGLYKWGEGWDIATKKKWDEFWGDINNRSIFWKYFKDNNECDYLFGIQGSIFLHPMNFSAILYAEFGDINNQIEELRKLCSNCAEYCGGAFDMEMKSKSVEF